MNTHQKPPITDTYSLSELKNSLKKIFGFLSICVTVSFIIIGTYLSLNNSSSYVNFYVFGILSRAPSLIIWMLYCLLYLRKYYPYQFLLILAPTFLLSDSLWNIEATIVRPCMIQNDLLTPHFITYIIVIISVASLVLILFKPKISKPNTYQMLLFIGFSSIYLLAGAPIVNVQYHVNECMSQLSQYIPQNISWELLWQIIFLLSFGTMFTKDRPKISIRWLFN